MQGHAHYFLVAVVIHRSLWMSMALMRKVNKRGSLCLYKRHYMFVLDNGFLCRL